MHGTVLISFAYNSDFKITDFAIGLDSTSFNHRLTSSFFLSTKLSLYQHYFWTLLCLLPQYLFYILNHQVCFNELNRPQRLFQCLEGHIVCVNCLPRIQVRTSQTWSGIAASPYLDSAPGVPRVQETNLLQSSCLRTVSLGKSISHQLSTNMTGPSFYPAISRLNKVF